MNNDSRKKAARDLLNAVREIFFLLDLDLERGYFHSPIQNVSGQLDERYRQAASNHCNAVSLI